jgi:hypothetical protein
MELFSIKSVVIDFERISLIRKQTIGMSIALILYAVAEQEKERGGEREGASVTQEATQEVRVFARKGALTGVSGI